MKKEMIRIKGARENNLKNIDLEVPRNQFVVFTGLSGSGKSSLAFDTIYAEGQRRYMESVAQVNLLWLLIRFMRRDRDVIWSLCHPMPDSSLVRWRNRM